MKFTQVNILLLFILLSSGLYGQKNSETQNKNNTVIKTSPVFPGCEKVPNDKKEKCFQEQLNRHVANHFNLSKEIIDRLNVDRITLLTSFEINEEGKTTSVKPKFFGKNISEIDAQTKIILEEEAIRVFNLLPKIKPAMQDGKPVSISYSIPIIYIIPKTENKTKKPNLDLSMSFSPDVYPIYRGCNENEKPEIIKECTIREIKDFLVVSFDIEMASKLFPHDKSTKFLAEFVIDKKGKIKNINAKAHKKEIAIEAIQVLRRLPKCKTPGYKDGKPVDTPFRFMMTLVF